MSKRGIYWLLAAFISIVLALPAMAQIAYRGAASAAGTPDTVTYRGAGTVSVGDGSATPGLPSGWQAGDLHLCIVAGGNNKSLSMSGWTQLQAQIGNDSGTKYSFAIFYRLAQSGDGTPTLSMGGSGSGTVQARIIGFYNVDQSTPIESGSVFTDSGQDQSTEANSIATTINNSMLVFTTHAIDNYTSVGLPSGGGSWTQAFFDANTLNEDTSIAAHYRLMTTAGTAPAQSSTRSGGVNARAYGGQLAIRPRTLVTIPVPSGTIADDVMIASITARPSGTTISTPSGWTLLGTTTQSNDVTSGMATYRRIASGSEPGSYTWVLGGTATTGAVGGVVSFSGVDTATPIDGSLATSQTGLGWTHTAPSVTTSVANTMLVTSHEFTTAATWSPPTGMTEAVDKASETTPAATGISLEMNHQSIAATGATGTRTATAASTAPADQGYGITHSLALRPMPRISIATPAAVNEGNSGTTTLSFTVSLNAASGNAVTASYATSDSTAVGGASCTTGVDYVTASGIVTIPAGTTTGAIDVTICGDTTYELDETFTVTLSSPSGAVLGTSTATGTITNDDSQPTISVATVSATEGNSGSSAMSFTVSLSNASYQNVSASFSTANVTATGGATCTADVDYLTSSGTVTILAGSTSTTIPITICGDTTFEPHETFSVTLSSPVNATVGTASATGTILNDEALAWYKMDEGSWTGTSEEVRDASGNGYHASRGGLATTAATTPFAYGDSAAGTCSYGRFDQTGTPNPYVQLPSSFPDVNFSFTVTAWIRTTDKTAIGQRIFVRDDVNDGWGISLSDGGAGKLRLYNRNTSPTTIADTSAVIENDTWYFVAAAVDMTNKGATLYIYSGTGTQLAKTSATYTGTWGTGTGATAIGSDTSVSSENATYYFRGNIDEVTVFNTALDQTTIESTRTKTRSCSCTLGSFRLTQASTALACPDTRAQLTVEPLCADGATVKNDYAGTVNLSTSPASGSYYDAASGGNAISSVAFLSGDLSKTAYLYYPNESSVCAVANDGSVSTTSTSCTSFHAYGFKVSQQPADQVCGATSQVKLTAYGKTLSGAGQTCEVIAGFSGNKNLKAWFTSGIDPDNTATAQTANRTLNITGSASGITDKTEPAAANLSNVNFSSGVATLAVSYPNAAKILGINFKHDTSPYNGGACAATAPFCPLTAVTDAFVAYPNFALTVTDSGSGCAAGDSTCSVFKAAGSNFNMKLQALCSDGTTLATDYVNGTTAIDLGVNSLVAPSGGSTGAVGTTTLNVTTGGEKAFTQQWSEVGVATFKATPPVWFGHTFSAAATGNIGRFRPDRFSASGVLTTRSDTYARTTGTASAASMTLTVASATGIAIGNTIIVLGAGPGSAPLKTTVGAVAGTTVTLAAATTNSVSGATVYSYGALDAFTYMDEPMLLLGTVTALNASGSTTTNYAGSFAKLDAATLTAANWKNVGCSAGTQCFGIGAINGAATPLTARLAVDSSLGGPASGWASGVGTFLTHLTFSRPTTTTPDATWGHYGTLNVGIAPLDSDGVTIASPDLDADGDSTNERTKVATTAVRFGRLRISNAFGSEKSALAMPVQAQYWSGNSWVLNSDDNRTSVPANAFFLLGGIQASTGVLVAVQIGAPPNSPGNGTLTLTAPSTVGSVDIAANLGTSGNDQSCLSSSSHGGTAAGLPWLRSRNGSKYLNDGTPCPQTYDRDPSARATFGIYTPESRRTVHIREQF